MTDAASASPLDHAARERLWWIAIAAINNGLDKDVDAVLDALRDSAEHANAVRVADAFRLWRRARSRHAPAALDRLAQDAATRELALGFLAVVQLDSGLVPAALGSLGPLLSSTDDRARQIAHAVMAAVTRITLQRT